VCVSAVYSHFAHGLNFIQLFLTASKALRTIPDELPRRTQRVKQASCHRRSAALCIRRFGIKNGNLHARVEFDGLEGTRKPCEATSYDC
jgi:hypothetical protein